jgi:hypothetical protein
MSVVWLAQSELDAYIGWLLCYPGRCQWTSVSVEVIAMADVMKGSDPDDGIETTDLSAEAPTSRVGPPWRLEPPEIVVRGRAAEMVTSVGCMFATLAGLRFVFGVPLYPALVVAIVVPLLYRDVGREGRGKLRVALKWWHRRQ